MLSAKRVLVSGATGFVGACLAHRLVRLGADVHLIRRETSNTWRLRKIERSVTSHIADLSDRESLAGIAGDIRPDVVFHLATYGGYPGQRDVSRMIGTNVTGTVNLLQACLKAGCAAFVASGSSSEYGSKCAPMRETDLLEPITPYGVTKSAAALYCRYLGRQERLPVVTLRLFSPYGYYEEGTRLVPTVIRACLAGVHPRLASGNAVRDFIFVEDVVDAYCLAAERSDLHGEIINIGSGKQHSVAEVVETVLDITRTGVEPEWGSVPGRSFDTAVWEADIGKARELLGWSPRHSLRKGLELTVQWFRGNPDLYKNLNL